ncbi:insulinase family protein [Paraglaciecola aestuariivivens]
MLKSTYDKRQFNYIESENGLRVLLVEDPQSTKSACSISLNVGHFNDPDDCHGLSHLLEHLLFLGNQSFKQANAFHDFLALHSGSVNALTGTEYTRYFFDVSQQQEQQGLTHLKAMLCSPLFLEDNIAKEIHAIDAEFLLKQKDDLRRLYQVHKETCNPAHPFSKFSVGNQHTFAAFDIPTLKTKLQELHQSYYQPNNACLCFISQSPLAKSEDMIQALFSDWSAHPLPKQPDFPDLYLPQHKGLKINILPLQKAKRLILTFALPGQLEYFRTKPLSILSHILGDEGKGGLLDFYKKQNWATTLSAGGGIEGSNFKDFNINLQLTDLGIQHEDQIIAGFFSYIQLLQTKGIESWRIKETAMLNQLMWDFPDHAKPIDEATHLSQAMFEYPPNYVIAGDYIIDFPCAKTVMQMLSFFTPENMRIKSVNPEVKTEKQAKWYDTPYSTESLSTDKLQKFKQNQFLAEFSLPQANPFLQTRSEIQPVNANYTAPQPILSQEGLNIWYGQDDKFCQPKGDCFLTFDCLAVNQGVAVSAAKRLWVALLNEKLNQKYYQANLAGMHFHFYPHQCGFSLQTNGFSSKQLEFCAELLTEIVTNNDFSETFEQVKAKQMQSLSNALLNKPVNRLFTRLAVLLQQQNYSPIDTAKTMANLTVQDISSVPKTLLNQFHLEGLMYGDWSLKEAQWVCDKISRFRQGYASCEKIHRGVADIRNIAPSMHHVECQHSDPAVVIYYQAPDASLSKVALSILFEQMIAAPFFNQLRTEQQLGYLVGSGYIPYNQHPGIGFYIQSPHASTEQLVFAIKSFINEFFQHIEQFKTMWEPLKNGLIKQLAEKDTNLSMKSQRLWMAIGNNDFDFSSNHQLKQCIQDMHFADLKDFVQSLVSGQGFGELVLYNQAPNNSQALARFKIVKNMQDFKHNSQYL